MEVGDAPPLMVCLEKADGQEVALQIQPSDDFHTFLLKARSLLGYEIDINSVTHNQPVALTDNVYQFLLNCDSQNSQLNQPILPTANTEDLYILDDGTQIRASQIHFDNDDPPVDLTAEKIPFVKHGDVTDDVEEDNIQTETKIYNIVDSPVRFNKDVSNSLIIPFQLVSNNVFNYLNNSITSGYETQFAKNLEVRQQSRQIKTYATLNTVTNRNKSPRSLIKDSFKNIDDNIARNSGEYTHYTREDILNIFKDAPVSSAPCESQLPEKRRHSRKSDPSRPVHKSLAKPISYINVDGVLIAETECQNCFICGKFVDNNHQKLYLFDNEDQRLHRSSPQKKLATQLKIICDHCLKENFRPCRKAPNQSLNPDEYLVIRNNQQYIFQKIKSTSNLDQTNCKKDENIEKFRLEIGSDGEIVSQALNEEDNAAKKQGRNKSSSDVEIVENEDDFADIVDLEEADEEVIEFLGKYQCDGSEITELKCRFCLVIFGDISEMIDHGEEHKHILDDGAQVFPCPLCDYGYANYKWLKGHLKAAHGDTVKVKSENKSEDNVEPVIKEGKGDGREMYESPECSPIAKRTRSAKANENKDKKEPSRNPEEGQKQSESQFEIKTEVKQETVDSDGEEIWIVQASEDVDNQETASEINPYKCDKCRVIFVTADTLAAHKCRNKRGQKNKSSNYICVPSQKDFIKRAQGRARRNTDDYNDNDLLVRPRKKKATEPSSDPQILTCHNCNESFTSKVRLKFHMQFHDKSSMLTPEGKYQCVVCDKKQFGTETALFDHVHFQHHKQSRWQCPIAGCGKTFYLRATLTKHSRSHTDTRRYVCGTCGKRFLDKQTLDEHGVTHLRIKPFQCHICLKQLTRRSRLRMHLRAHEDRLCSRLVLVCAVCARAFRDCGAVQDHLKSSPACIEEFAKEVKEEETVQMQLSPTSGLVRHTVQIVESPKLSKPIPCEAQGPEAAALLATVSDAAASIIRCVEIEKAFRCEYCEDVFYSESGLNNHRVIHKNVKNPFTCHICKVSFATYSRCTTHKTTHGFYKRSLAAAKQRADTSGQEAGPCSTGILGYGDFPVAKHFLCEDCGRSYLHWTYLQVHRRMKHATDNFAYKCTHCDVTFGNSWSLAYHKKKQHGKPDQENGAGAANKPKERDGYRIPCRDCNEVLPNKTALYKHRKKEHSDLSLQMNNKTTVEIEPGVFWCGVCGGRFPSQLAALAHNCRPAHNDTSSHETDLTCEVCKKTFFTRAELNTHTRTHTERHAHTCAECGHAFRTLSMLTEHERTHSGERPYPCDICGVAFRRPTAMRNHRLIHSGVRAWGCSRCPKRFRIQSDLRTHLRLKHPTSLYVIEVPGLNPTPEQVMQRLTMNNIPHERVIEITKIAFPKGVTGVVPNSARALAALAALPGTRTDRLTALHARFDLNQPARRGRGIAKHPRKPKILQRGGDGTSQNQPQMTYTQNILDTEDQQQLQQQYILQQQQKSILQLQQQSILQQQQRAVLQQQQQSVSHQESIMQQQQQHSIMQPQQSVMQQQLESVMQQQQNVMQQQQYVMQQQQQNAMQQQQSYMQQQQQQCVRKQQQQSVMHQQQQNVMQQQQQCVMQQQQQSVMHQQQQCVMHQQQQSVMQQQQQQQNVMQQQQSTTAYPMSLNVSNEDISELNMQLLLRDGVFGNGNQMVQLQQNDSML